MRAQLAALARRAIEHPDFLFPGLIGPIRDVPPIGRERRTLVAPRRTGDLRLLAHLLVGRDDEDLTAEVDRDVVTLGRGVEALRLVARVHVGDEVVLGIERHLDDDPTRRAFYTDLCAQSRWSVRTLRERMDGLLFERQLEGWYVLAGDVRDYELAIPADVCSKLKSIEIDARTDSAPPMMISCERFESASSTNFACAATRCT